MLIIILFLHRVNESLTVHEKGNSHNNSSAKPSYTNREGRNYYCYHLNCINGAQTIYKKGLILITITVR